MRPLSRNSELLADRESTLITSSVDEFLHAAAYAGIQTPVSGMTQLIDKATGTELSANVQFVKPLKERDVYSALWHSQTIGSAVGMIVPFCLLHRVVSRGTTSLFGVMLKSCV